MDILRAIPSKPAVNAFAAAAERAGRVLVACGVSATLFWAAAAAADDPVERILSLVSQERYSEAREALEPLLQREPDAPRLRLVLGVLEAHEGNTGEAVEIFERLRSDQPELLEPHNNLAVLHAREGRLDAARDALVAALQRGADAVAYANLGDVYMQLADRAYSRARELSGGGVASKDPPAQAKPTAVAEDITCVHAGGFRNRAAAAEAAEWLRLQGAEAVETRHETQLAVKSHRVYLPALSSGEAAEAKLRELRGRGLRDVVVLRNGAWANQISLGVYRSEQNARRRVAQLEKLGITAKSEPNMKMLSVYVVEARVGGGRPALDSAWTAKFPGNAIVTIECS